MPCAVLLAPDRASIPGRRCMPPSNSSVARSSPRVPVTLLCQQRPLNIDKTMDDPDLGGAVKVVGFPHFPLQLLHFRKQGADGICVKCRL